MSLGFDIDFFAVVNLVNQIRKSFVGAPEQFRAISDDVRGFSIVLQDVEASCTEFSPEQSQEYQAVVTGCKRLLDILNKTLEKYASVAEAGKTGKKTAIRRVWKRLKWEPDDIRDIRSEISVKIATLRTLNDHITSHNIAKLIRHQQDTEREATLEWVSDINYVAQQNDIFLRCQIGSRRWLFESEVYLEWCKRKGRLLFCPGNAGTGKTFTTAMVVESLRLANDAETLTIYMYCSYQNHTQSMEKLLCSLLRVALEEADREADETISTCKQLRSSNKIISRQYCLSLLQDLFSRFTRVNLIVDALDELTNEVRRPLIYDLLKLHGQSNVNLFVTSRGIPEIQHLFEGCEMYTSLEVRSSDEDIQNFLRDNILQLPNFVTRSLKLQDEVIDSVTNASAGMFLLAELYLKSLADIKSVGRLRTRISNLATGSNAYDTLYEDSMLRIGFQGPESERIAVQMLLVLTCTRRPLSPQELSHALSIDENSEAFDEDMVPDMDDLVAACTGLVVLDDASNIVHLVHKSAAEYFERTRSRWFPRANEKMAVMCLRYLQIADIKPVEIRGEQAPFFHYAKANWSYHSIEAEKEAAKEAAVSDALQPSSTTTGNPLPNSFTFTQLAIHQMFKEIVDVQSSIIEACNAGHQALVEQLLVVRNYDVNANGTNLETFLSNRDLTLVKQGFSSTPFKDNVLLTIAVAREDYSMTQMLLARGADPNIFNAIGETPLSIAITNNFDNLVSLLLDQKLIKPDLMCPYSDVLSTAFLASIELNREGCFKLLLERSNRRSRDELKRGAMWLAASSGYNSIISELLKWSDVEIDYTDTDFCGSPLALAVRCRQEESALLLLPNAKCRSCDKCGITPMHYAIRNGLHSLLKRLLEHDSSAVDCELRMYLQEKNVPDAHFLGGCELHGTERTRTPLLTAIYLQDAQAVHLLLPYADVNQGLTWRPLHGAAEWGNAEIFELLLQKENVEPDPVDEHGRTPFLLAAERGNCAIMNALIKKGGVQFDRMDAKGYTVVDYIIPNCFQHPCYFHLLTSIIDIDVNKRDSTGSSLLHQACRLHPEISYESDSEFEIRLSEHNPFTLVADLLKRTGVDVNLLDKEGNTPLLLAVKNHQRDIVNLLLEREDTDVLIQDVDGNDALLLASFHIPMFKQLPQFSSPIEDDMCIWRGDESTWYMIDQWPEALNSEFREHDEYIFSMLLHDKRADLYRRNNIGENIMTRVAMTGTKNMVQAVLETTELASDLEVIKPDGNNLLCLALQKNQDDDAVDLLISHFPAAVLQRADTEGLTPLSYAVQRNTSRATQSLLAIGIDTKAVDSSGRTSLSYAAERGHPDTARLVIAADETLVNTPDCDGLTPLMYATHRLNISVVSAFLKRSDINILALDDKGHSFLCHLMMSYCSNKFGDGSECSLQGELYDVIHRIHRLLQLHVPAIKTYIHSPFICAVENHEPRFTFLKRRVGLDSIRRKKFVKDIREKFVGFMKKLQRYAILSDYFHPGLDFSRCTGTTGLLEILDEEKDDDDYDDQNLCLRALRLYVSKDTSM